MPSTRTRTLAKSTTYRLITIGADLFVVYYLTHRYDTTIGVTVFTNLASTALYYSHERFWNKIPWGRK